MTDRPLIPGDVDLRCYDTMPLDVVKLRESSFAARVNGDEFMAGVFLWCASFHQVPAGSVPDDDYDLSNLAGYGRAVGEWKRLRNKALYGFVKGGDGRLYHRTVTRVAFFDCWMTRLRWLHSAEQDRLRKHNKSNETNPSKQVPIPQLQTFVRDNYPETAAYLDVLEDMHPPIGWTLLQRGMRRGFTLPENIPLPPEKKAFKPGEAKASGGKLQNSTGNKRGDDTDLPPNEPEIALNGTEQEGKGSIPPTPLAGGGVGDSPDFEQFVATGGERWRGMRVDLARPVWDERIAEGIEPALLVAAAQAYFQWREGEDKRRGDRQPGTVVSPVTFLRAHWTRFRVAGEFMLDGAGDEGPDLGEPGRRLREHLGDVRYAKWFSGAVLDLEASPARLIVPRPWQKAVIDRQGGVERCIGVSELVVEVAP